MEKNPDNKNAKKIARLEKGIYKIKKEASAYREIYRNPNKVTEILYRLRKSQKIKPYSFQSRKTNRNTERNKRIVVAATI